MQDSTNLQNRAKLNLSKTRVTEGSSQIFFSPQKNKNKSSKKKIHIKEKGGKKKIDHKPPRRKRVFYFL